MTQANDSARSLRTLGTNSSVLRKAILEVAADQLDQLQAKLGELNKDFAHEVDMCSQASIAVVQLQAELNWTQKELKLKTEHHDTFRERINTVVEQLQAELAEIKVDKFKLAKDVNSLGCDYSNQGKQLDRLQTKQKEQIELTRMYITRSEERREKIGQLQAKLDDLQWIPVCKGPPDPGAWEVFVDKKTHEVEVFGPDPLDEDANPDHRYCHVQGYGGLIIGGDECLTHYRKITLPGLEASDVPS